MSKRYFLTALILSMFMCCNIYAQVIPSTRNIKVDSTVMILNSMTVDDYLAIELPPLDTLYYNAYCMSNAVKYYDEEANYYSHAVTTEKLKPLDWVRLITSASYGNSDITGAIRNEASYPIWIESTSAQRSFYYNVGVSLNIPLGEVFNTRNKIRQAQAKLRQTESRRNSELDVIKKDIIDLYCAVLQGINSLKTASEKLVIAKAQYEFAETDFVNNKITAEVLYRCKSYEAAAVQDFEQVRKNINQALLTLEVVSCTKIIMPVKH